MSALAYDLDQNGHLVPVIPGTGISGSRGTPASAPGRETTGSARHAPLPSPLAQPPRPADLLLDRSRDALLTPFTSKYFDAIAGVWERRSSEVAQTVVIGMYPSWDVSQAGLDAADRFLVGDIPPALRRLVIEGRAGVERALRARAFDSA